MKRVLTKNVLMVAGLACLLPVAGNATTVSLSLSGFSGGTSTIGGASITFTTLDVAGTNVTDTITETYSYSGGVGTLSFKAATTNATYGLVSGQTFLTITESGSDLLPNTSPSAVNLYQNAYSLVFNDTTLAGKLGLQYTSLGSTQGIALGVVGGSFSDTATSGTVSSGSGLITFNTSTPEPSTFAMLGIALFAGLGVSLRKKLALNRLS